MNLPTVVKNRIEQIEEKFDYSKVEVLLVTENSDSFDLIYKLVPIYQRGRASKIKTIRIPK